ncbi:MAG: PAS domain-containing protein [Alphaproteobacteria bacterium]|nr:PAS domain-containing protein [Alphaproteobacteria bacterium]
MNHSLSSRITVLVVLAVLAASALIGGGSFVLVRQQLSDAIAARLSVSEANAAEKIESRLAAITSSLEGLAANRLAANALVDSMGRDTYLGPFLDGFQRMSGVAADIILLDYKGRPLGKLAKRSFGAVEMPWLAGVVRTGHPAARVERLGGAWRIVLAWPVIYSNTRSPQGVLALALPLAELTRDGLGGAEGISHHLDIAGMHFDPTTGEGHEPRVDGRSRSIAAPAPLDSLGIRLDTEVDAALLRQPLERMALYYGVVVLLVAGVVGVGGGMVGRTITAPLRSLAAEAAEVSIDDASGHFVRPSGDPKEIATLARAFRGMVERLDRESRALVHNAQKVANVGTWRWRIGAQSMEWSENLASILGVPADGPASLDAMGAALRPEDASGLQGALAGAGAHLQMDAQTVGPSARHLVVLADRRDDEVGGPVWDGTVMDVTALRRAEMALIEKEAALRAILDNFPFMIWLKDVEGRLVAVNTVYAQACGRDDPAQVVGLADADLWPPDLAASHVADDRAVLETGQRKMIDEPVSLDGERRWVETFKTPVRDPAGRVLGTAGFARDISARVRDQESLKRMTAELSRSNADLEQFAYAVSHDLRQPLRMVNSYLTLLGRKLGDRLDGESTGYIGFAVDGARRMDALITGLLEFSRVGRAERPFEPIDLGVVVDGVLGVLGVAIEEAGARLAVAGGLPVVRGDEMELIRLFQNLIGNAVKYRAPDHPPTIEIGWREALDEWVVWVKDDGIGIDPKNHERAFQIFQRLVAKDAYEGTGIGLAICRKIAHHHGGRIWIHSQPGQGATFLVAFPKLRA